MAKLRFDVSTSSSTEVVEESLDNIGATVMGRNMFGGGPEPWGEDPWDGDRVVEWAVPID